MTKPELNTAVDQFVAKYNGKKVDFDGAYGAQCFDLFQFYNRDVIGGPFVTGNGAKDIWDTYPKNLYIRIPNTPEGVPSKGDVMIWGSGYGIYGHVAIVLEADVNKFKALSQNDPVGRETYIRTYDYYQTLGWLSPKVTTVTPPISDRRPYWFDRINTVTFKKPHEQIKDMEVEKFVKDYPTQLARSGKWDRVVLRAFGQVDTNTITDQQLWDMIAKENNDETLKKRIVELEKKLKTVSTKHETLIKGLESLIAQAKA